MTLNENIVELVDHAALINVATYKLVGVERNGFKAMTLNYDIVKYINLLYGCYSLYCFLMLLYTFVLFLI